MQKWQYLVEEIGIESLEADLNEHGANGFEAVALWPKVGPIQGVFYVLLKRPVS
jgi:hypothetical protein